MAQYIFEKTQDNQELARLRLIEHALDKTSISRRRFLRCPAARMMGESTRALREKYLATGEAGSTDIESYIRNANNSSFWSVYYSTVSVVAVQTGASVPGCPSHPLDRL